MQRRVGAVLAVAITAAGIVTAAAPLAEATSGSRHHRPDPTRTVAASIASGRILFVGASYSIGLGATGPSASIPDLIAHQLDREFRVDAISGTGYQNPGPHHQGTFFQRISDDPNDPPPRIVVIQGGRDDTGFPLSREYEAVYSTIVLAQHRFPQAQVVLLGPIPATLPVSAKVEQIRIVLAHAAQAAGAGWIDPIADGWITRANAAAYRGRVPGHPNDAGYAYLADKLVDALPGALQRAAPPMQKPTGPGGHGTGDGTGEPPPAPLLFDPT